MVRQSTHRRETKYNYIAVDKTVNIFEIKKGYFKVYDGETAYNLYIDDTREFPELNEPEYYYDFAQRVGLDEEHTIDFMLKNIHRRRIFKGGWLGGLCLAIAFTGTRGAGKSVALTAFGVIDGLLAGRRVVSNMPIEIKVKYKDCQKIFQSEELLPSMLLDINEFTKNYYNCLMLIDEINVFIADAQRSMSNESYYFALALQQMRHRKLDFGFTTQNENWQTDRTQFQTDFYVKCSDNAMGHGTPKKEEIGRKSLWKIHDMSGLVTGEVLKTVFNKVMPYTEKVFWNTPFWNCYSTELMQRRNKVDFKKKEKQENDYKINMDMLEAYGAALVLPTEIAMTCLAQGIPQIQKAALWQIVGIDGNRNMQVKVGKLLKDLGVETVGGTTGKAFRFPDADVIEQSMRRNGFTMKEPKGDSVNV